MHTFSIALIVRLATNTRASNAVNRLTTLLLAGGGWSGSQADGVLDCLHACCVVDLVEWLRDVFVRSRRSSGDCDVKRRADYGKRFRLLMGKKYQRYSSLMQH